jgi:hypothetical protein
VSTSRRIWNLILEIFHLKRTPFVLHEAYPEIVFWEVGQEVEIKGEEREHEGRSESHITSAVVQDFDKNGQFVFRIKGPERFYPYKTVISDQIYTLQFVGRVSPSTIHAKGTILRNNSRTRMIVSDIFNPQIRGRGSYMELLKSIREVVGIQDWEEPSKLAP